MKSLIPNVKYFTNKCLLGLFLCILTLSASFMTTGCTTAQINNVETIIAADLPTILTDVTSILSIISALTTTSGDTTTSTLSTVITEIQTKGTAVETILASYKAGTSKWADVVAAVDALEASASTTIDLSGIKDADSQAKAKVWIAAIDLAVDAVYTAVLTTQSTATVKARLATQKTTLKAHEALWTASQRNQFVSQLLPVTGFASFEQYQTAM
jgi:hypothetical protein